MVGGIYAISRLIKIKTHSDTIFIVFSILYWPLIHNYYNLHEFSWYSFGFGVISLIYMKQQQIYGNLISFFSISILHAFVNAGVLVAIKL